jgi:hypothetical protein
VSHALQVIWKIPEELKKGGSYTLFFATVGEKRGIVKSGLFDEPMPKQGIRCALQSLAYSPAIATSEIHFPQRKAPPVDNLFTEGAFH